MKIEDKPRALLLGVIGLLLVVLLTTVVLQPGSFFYDTTNYARQKKLADLEAKEYKKILSELRPDYEASQKLLKKIATEEVVRTEVVAALRPDQSLAIPNVSDADIKVGKTADANSLASYFNDVGSMIVNYNKEASSDVNGLFADLSNPDQIERLSTRTTKLVSAIKGREVPAPAVPLHKAQIAGYQKYLQYLSTAQSYATGKNTNPWSNVYGQYAVINDRFDFVKTQMGELSKQYALDTLPYTNQQDFLAIKTAHAGFPVIDVWQVAWEGIKAGLARAFTNFTVVMIDRLVAQIEKNFAIASQLYYSNELGRIYSVEYLKKFVSSTADQAIIQNFLPEYFCVPTDPAKMKQIFVAKALESQGDITLNPNDPDFLVKLANLGRVENFPQWWESYYMSLAAQTRSEAEKAATKEVISPGLKSARDIVNGQVTKTMSTIFGVQEAAIQSTMNLGSNNADNMVGQIIAGIVQNLVNKFIFTPIAQASGAGGIGVAQESDVCLGTPKIRPIVPAESVDYEKLPTDLPSVEPDSEPLRVRNVQP